jgi:hypothetical protein
VEEDKELNAMGAVKAALEGLDQDTLARVVRWAAERYKVTLSDGKNRVAPPQGAGEDEELPEFATFSEFYAAAEPSNDAERVLVAGYWFQVLKKEEELESQMLSKELTNTGNRVEHMPHAVDDLVKVKPQLVVQLKKSGTTKQARKKFKLTTAGVKKVESMVQKPIE